MVRPRLPDAVGARQAGESLLRTLAAALSPTDAEWPERLRGITPLPSVFRPSGLLYISSPRGPAGDHWLFRAQASLRASGDGRESALVFGGQAELRIGDGGRLIGYVGRWRALSGEMLRVPRTPFVPEADEKKDDAPPPRLTYVLEGDGLPQYYLAPYHLVEASHDAELASASAYSLVVSVSQQDSEEGTELTARASGGSGDYAYNWAEYSFDDVLDRGIRGLGTGMARRESDGDAAGATVVSSIAVPLGARVVLVNVKDRATGAFKHHQQQVFSTPPAVSGAGDGGWGT
jgi:hypothetical protein